MTPEERAKHASGVQAAAMRLAIMVGHLARDVVRLEAEAHRMRGNTDFSEMQWLASEMVKSEVHAAIGNQISEEQVAADVFRRWPSFHSQN